MTCRCNDFINYIVIYIYPDLFVGYIYLLYIMDFFLDSRSNHLK